jgi:hypothetical protein
MSTRRKFRRNNNRKSRRRGKRGGGEETLCLGDHKTYDDVIKTIRWRDKEPNENIFDLTPEDVADYYLNKALTQDEKNGGELYVGKDNIAAYRAKRASKHKKGIEMQKICLKMMKNMVEKYNNASSLSTKITEINSLNRDNGTPWSCFTITDFSENKLDEKHWEAQNCYLTAGDTRNLGLLGKEKAGMEKGGKQSKAGFLIGKLLSDIGHNIGHDIMVSLKVGSKIQISGWVGDTKYGLESFSGLRNSAILLFLCYYCVMKGQTCKNKADILNIIKTDKITIKNLFDSKSFKNNEKMITEKDKRYKVTNLNGDTYESAKTMFKNIIINFMKNEENKDRYILNLKMVESVLQNCDKNETGIKLENKTKEQNVVQQKVEGGRRRRRKRRTKRGGKSRRRKRRTKRRRRRKRR